MGSNATNRRRISGRNVKRRVGSEAVDAHERRRDYITEEELERLVEAAKGSRHRWRDAAIMRMLFRHGLRVSELCSMQVDDLDLNTSRVWVMRRKGSLSTEHPVQSDTMRVLKRYLKERGDVRLPWLFVSAQGNQLTRQSINYLVRVAGERAGLPMRVHPHMFRHGCGYALANRGHDLRAIQDYLGHRDPKHTARYTRTSAERFGELWRR